MKLIMESWRKFLIEKFDFDETDSEDAFSDLENIGKGPSPEIMKLQQRLEKLGISNEDSKSFIDFEGMSATRGASKIDTLEKKVAALERFANTPINKMPQTMKVTPGEEIDVIHGRRSWKGKVGDPKAPPWVQMMIPGWKTNNPIWPKAPMDLGLYGKTILFQKLRAAGGKIPQAAAQQKKAPPATDQEKAQAQPPAPEKPPKKVVPLDTLKKAAAENPELRGPLKKFVTIRPPKRGMVSLKDVPTQLKKPVQAAVQKGEGTPGKPKEKGPFRKEPNLPAYEKKHKGKPVADFSKDKQVMRQRGKKRKFRAAYRRAKKAGIKYFHVPGLKYKIYAVG